MRKDKIKPAKKLREQHTYFICKKVAQESMSDAQIADLFNSVYGEGRYAVIIDYKKVNKIRNQKSYKEIINDYRQQYSKPLDQNRYCDLAFCSQILLEIIEVSRATGKHRDAFHGIELILKINGKLAPRTEINENNILLREPIKQVLALFREEKELRDNLSADDERRQQESEKYSGAAILTFPVMRRRSFKKVQSSGNVSNLTDFFLKKNKIVKIM